MGIFLHSLSNPKKQKYFTNMDNNITALHDGNAAALLEFQKKLETNYFTTNSGQGVFKPLNEVEEGVHYSEAASNVSFGESITTDFPDISNPDITFDDADNFNVNWMPIINWQDICGGHFWED